MLSPDDEAILNHTRRLNEASAMIRVIVDCLPDHSHVDLAEAISGIATTIDEAACGIEAARYRLVKAGNHGDG